MKKTKTLFWSFIFNDLLEATTKNTSHIYCESYFCYCDDFDEQMFCKFSRGQLFKSCSHENLQHCTALFF